MKKQFIFALCFIACSFCYSAPPTKPINANFQLTGQQWDLRTKVGNTPNIVATMYDGDDLWDATGWTFTFKFGRNRNSDNMVSIAGVVTSNTVSFQAMTNTFGSPIEKWYCAITASHTNNYVNSDPEGIITIKRAPEVDSGTLSFVRSINPSLYTFSGSTATWPFLSDQDGSAVGDLTYFNGTNWISISAGTSGYILLSQGLAAPIWTNITSVVNINGGDGIDVTVSGGTNTIAVDATVIRRDGIIDFTGDQDHGSNAVTGVEYQDFEPLSADPAHQAGRVFYNATDDSWKMYFESSEVTMNVGEELWFPGRNNTGSTITNGQVVYVTGQIGQKETVALARANNETTAKALAFATEEILNNENGKCTIFGSVGGLNTTAIGSNSGSDLFLSATTFGLAQTNAPTGETNYIVRLGKLGIINPVTGNVNINIHPAIMANEIFGLNSEIAASQAFTNLEAQVTANLDTNTIQQNLILTNQFWISANSDSNAVNTSGVANNIATNLDQWVIIYSNQANIAILDTNTWKISESNTAAAGTTNTHATSKFRSGTETANGYSDLALETFNVGTNSVINVVDGVNPQDAATISQISTVRQLLNAMPTNRPVLTYSSDGTNVTIAVTTTDGSGSFDVFFDDTLVQFATPINLTLTPGTTNSLQMNYVYALAGGVTNGTTFPTGEYSPMFDIGLLDALFTQNTGLYSIRRHTDEVSGPNGDDRSAVQRLMHRVRLEPSRWLEGGDLAAVVTTQGGANDDVYLTITAGISAQLHEQTFPAVTATNGSVFYIIDNHPDGKQMITNLNQITVDANSNAVLSSSVSYFNVVVMKHVSSGTTGSVGEVHLNLSTDDYASQANAQQDVNQHAVYSVSDPRLPGQFIVVGFATLHRTPAGGGTFDVTITPKLGTSVGSAGGGASSPEAKVNFTDAELTIFDAVAPTNIIRFNADATGGDMTYTMPEANGGAGTVALTTQDETFDADVGITSNLTVTLDVNINDDLSVADNLNVGTSATATGGDSFASGTLSDASGSDSCAIGNSAEANAFRSIAIGNDATASSSAAIAIGDTTVASGASSLSLGAGNNASGSSAIVLGNNSGATATDSMALGEGAISSNENSVVWSDGTAQTSSLDDQWTSRFASGYRILGAGPITLDGSVLSNYVAGAGSITTNTPTDGQIAKWNATDQRWQAAAATASSGGPLDSRAQTNNVNGNNFSYTNINDLASTNVSLTQPPFFTVHMSTQQNITNAIATRMEADLIIDDNYSGYDTNLFRYNPQVPGSYHFVANIRMDAVADQAWCWIALYKAGAIQNPSMARVTASGSSFNTLRAVYCMHLATNEYIEVFLFNNDSTVRVANEAFALFQGHYIGE